MVGDPDQCPSGCETSFILGDKGSPNNDPGADGTTAIMWHEFSETSSDPEVNLVTAWAGNFCGESGDCCAWLFGTVHTDSQRSLLHQQDWDQRIRHAGNAATDEQEPEWKHPRQMRERVLVRFFAAPRR